VFKFLNLEVSKMLIEVYRNIFLNVTKEKECACIFAARNSLLRMKIGH
jgi:hypothetical protein